MFVSSNFSYTTRVIEETDSTNKFAKRIIDEISRPTWIMARRQTAGIGRRGRAWSDPSGNLATSLVFICEEAPQKMALRSYVAALAVFDACVMLTGREDIFSIKWPNDILLKGRKLAGILLEMCKNTLGQDALVIGIGVNLVHAPKKQDLPEPSVAAASLFTETGQKVAQEDFLNVLADCFARYECQFRDQGFAPIRTALLQRAARLGEIITARLPHQIYTGRFETIDENGHLVMTTPHGERKISSADVFFKE